MAPIIQLDPDTVYPVNSRNNRNLDSPSATVDRNVIKEILQLGRAVTDRSSLAKWQDSSAYQLFTLRQRLKGSESDSFRAMQSLLPWVLIA
jgi:hypothetical protein